MAINDLIIPYPDFQYNTTINSEEFDANNNAIKVKVNEVIDKVNELVDPDVSVQFPQYLNNWTNNSPSYAGHYWKDGDGTVHYKLALKGGSKGTNVVVMVFPDGYKPARSSYEHGYSDGQTEPSFLYHVATNGEVKFLRTLTDNTLVIMNGSFKSA